MSELVAFGALFMFIGSILALFFALLSFIANMISNHFYNDDDNNNDR